MGSFASLKMTVHSSLERKKQPLSTPTHVWREGPLNEKRQLNFLELAASCLIDR